MDVTAEGKETGSLLGVQSFPKILRFNQGNYITHSVTIMLSLAQLFMHCGIQGARDLEILKTFAENPEGEATVIPTFNYANYFSPWKLADRFIKNIEVLLDCKCHD